MIPTMAARRTTASAVPIEYHEPYASLEKISRPISSVPKICMLPGFTSFAPISTVRGSYFVAKGPIIINRRIPREITVPMVDGMSRKKYFFIVFIMITSLSDL